MEIEDGIFDKLLSAAKAAQAELSRLFENQSDIDIEDLTDIALVDETVLGDLEEALDAVDGSEYEDEDEDEE